jgi:hypothetical protein
MVPIAQFFDFIATWHMAIKHSPPLKKALKCRVKYHVAK